MAKLKKMMIASSIGLFLSATCLSFYEEPKPADFRLLFGEQTQIPSKQNKQNKSEASQSQVNKASF